MKKVLVTGGTAFVSRYVAEYYVKKGYEVYVLNRNNGVQSEGVKLIQAEFINVYEDIEQDKYFCFNSFEYYLNVQKQNALMPQTKPIEEGLKESLEWYLVNKEQVKTKDYLKGLTS